AQAASGETAIRHTLIRATERPRDAACLLLPRGLRTFGLAPATGDDGAAAVRVWQHPWNLGKCHGKTDGSGIRSLRWTLGESGRLRTSNPGVSGEIPSI